jgi:hypothetical protein
MKNKNVSNTCVLVGPRRGWHRSQLARFQPCHTNPRKQKRHNYVLYNTKDGNLLRDTKCQRECHLQIATGVLLLSDFRCLPGNLPLRSATARRAKNVTCEILAFLMSLLYDLGPNALPEDMRYLSHLR